MLINIRKVLKFSLASLVGNVDIRDWLQGLYINTINGTSTKNIFLVGSGYFDETRLDMLIIDLPSEFENQTLQTMRIVDRGNVNVQRLILYGITMSTIPEPADFDEDGDVDTNDFHAWQSGFGIVASASHGDGGSKAKESVLPIFRGMINVLFSHMGLGNGPMRGYTHGFYPKGAVRCFKAPLDSDGHRCRPHSSRSGRPILLF
ncbi:MAG: hypothetical protein JW829_15665 [Pirellulales bacterium]|nr:hypothetical protein [Pirellulales bacterium]